MLVTYKVGSLNYISQVADICIETNEMNEPININIYLLSGNRITIIPKWDEHKKEYYIPTTSGSTDYWTVDDFIISITEGLYDLSGCDYTIHME